MRTLVTEGSLRTSSGCLLVGEFPAVWPHGTTWDVNGQAVQLSDGHERPAVSRQRHRRLISRVLGGPLGESGQTPRSGE